MQAPPSSPSPQGSPPSCPTSRPRWASMMPLRGRWGKSGGSSQSTIRIGGRDGRLWIQALLHPSPAEQVASMLRRDVQDAGSADVHAHSCNPAPPVVAVLARLVRDALKCCAWPRIPARLLPCPAPSPSPHAPTKTAPTPGTSPSPWATACLLYTSDAADD